VGENNILTGGVSAPSGGFATMDTPHGKFRARIAEGVSGTGVKLYVRPEHMKFSDQPGAENSVAVTISDVAFEGNFISVQALSDSGMHFVSELRNDGSVPIPDVGTRMHLGFDANKASILPDSATAGT
jgi:spermidine/putrescine transport system ATP-binding protein